MSLLNLIPPEVWKHERDRIVRAVCGRLHTTEVNPGPDASRLRYDYIVTRAEITLLVEETMRETERQIVYHTKTAKERITP